MCFPACVQMDGGGLVAESNCLQPPWTVAHQAPLSIRFPRQEYWSRLPFPSPGDRPDPGIKPISPALQTDSLLLSPQGSPLCSNSWFNIISVFGGITTHCLWVRRRVKLSTHDK